MVANTGSDFEDRTFKTNAEVLDPFNFGPIMVPCDGSYSFVATQERPLVVAQPPSLYACSSCVELLTASNKENFHRTPKKCDDGYLSIVRNLRVRVRFLPRRAATT